MYDPWLVRRLRPGDLRNHGYLELDPPAYMPSLIDAGADALATTGTISTAPLPP